MNHCFYTQGVAILLSAPVQMADLKTVLKGFKVTGESEAAPSWTTRGPSIFLELEPGSRGRIEVDIVNRRWPDADDGEDESELIAEARESGLFGPTCEPGALLRAAQFCTWPEGRDCAAKHQAFLRVRVTYSPLDGPYNTKLPADYSSTRECEPMLGVVEALLEHPASLCYFNPNGEVLASLEELAQTCDHYHKAAAPAINMLANRRFVKVENSDWMLVDVLGLGQVDTTDFEVCFTDRYDPNEMAVFLVKTALPMIKSGKVIKDGHTLEGPGGVLFEAKSFATSHLQPSREVVRFRPRDATVSPKELGFGEKPFGKRAWWQFWEL